MWDLEAWMRHNPWYDPAKKPSIAKVDSLMLLTAQLSDIRIDNSPKGSESKRKCVPKLSPRDLPENLQDLKKLVRTDGERLLELILEMKRNASTNV